VANRTFVIAGLAPERAAGTTATLVHVLPASAVAANVVHVPEAHVCAPITNPCVADTKVTEAGRNPASPAGVAVGVATTTGAVEAGPVDEGDPAAADDAAAEVAGAAGDDGAPAAADVTGPVPVGVAW